MGLINYKDITIPKADWNPVTFDFNGSEIQVTQYLSVKDKYDLIMVALQHSYVGGIYNDLLLKMYFELNIVFMYTNIVFSAEDRADSSTLYDTLQTSGLIEEVMKRIDTLELTTLLSMRDRILEQMRIRKGSLIGFLNEAIGDLPEKVQKAMDMLKEIDVEKLKAIVPPSMASSIGSLIGQNAVKYPISTN